MIFHKDLQDAMELLSKSPPNKSGAARIIQRIKKVVDKDEHRSKTLFRTLLFNAASFTSTLDEILADLLENPRRRPATAIRQRISEAIAKEEEILKDIHAIKEVLGDMKRA